MAWKQALRLGRDEYIFNCAILHNDILDAVVNSGTSYPYFSSSSASANAFDHLYSDLGDNVRDILGGNRPSYERTYLSALDTLALGFYKTYSSSTRWGVSIVFWNMSTGNENPQFDFTESGTWMNNKPSRISVLYDDDNERATLILAYFYGDSTCRVYNWMSGITSESKENNYKKFYNLVRPYITEISTDPWNSNNTSIKDGGDGVLDLTSDTIEKPSLPLGSVDTGFLQVFTPSLSEIKALSDYMWTPTFFDSVLKMWNDPMNIIINLSQFPFNVPSTNVRIVHAGNIITDLYMHYPDSQFFELDCGTITINKNYDAYLDYEPYTHCSIYLPYIGCFTLNMDDICGKTVNVKYAVDLTTGLCVANIFVDDSIMYTYGGSCSSNIPISGATYSDILRNIIDIGISGAKNGSSVGSIGSDIANGVMAMKPNVVRAGQLSSNLGFFAPQKPFLTFSIANVCLPNKQNEIIGYPSYITEKLSKLRGFTKVYECHLKGISCSSEELSEIESLLKGGVFV